MEWIKLLSFEF